MALFNLRKLPAYVGALLSGGGAGASAFLALTDTPGSYVGAAGQAVVVNGGATALEFAPGGGASVFATAAPFAVSTSTGALGQTSQYNCTDTAAPRTLTISSADIATAGPTSVWRFDVKDQSGGANANNIEITAEGAETIDGAASLFITENFASIALYSDGSNLFSRSG